jgi:sugar O-acyltransferase (sialic acid O-acetyltransferase NeuD family)
MLVIGAGGHAIEILDVLEKGNENTNLFFYDDFSTDNPKLFFEKYPILRDRHEIIKLFEQDKKFGLGIGSPLLRKKMALYFISLGGILTSIISTNSIIGNHNVILEAGLNIMHGVIITNNIKIGEGTLINANVCIHHGSSIGKYCEFSPGCHINGNVTIGDQSSIGTGAVIIPKINIGHNVIIGAGSVVTKNIPENSVAVGVPARIIKKLNPNDVY